MMNRFLYSLIALWLLVIGAASEPNTQLAAGGFGAGNNLTGFWQKNLAAAGETSIVYVDQTGSDLASVDNATFTDHATGTADAARKTIVVACAEDSASVFGVNSITVGGVSATEVAESPNTTARVGCSVYIVDNPSGTTATIVVTWSETITGNSSVSVFAAYNISSTITDSASGENASSSALIDLSLDIPANGIAVGACASHFNSTFSWNGLREQDDSNMVAAATVSVAHVELTAAATTRTASCDPSAANEHSGLAVSFAGTSSVIDPPATITFLQCATDATAQTTYTFTSQNVGYESSDRHTAIAIYGEDSAVTFSVSSATIDGSAASEVVDHTGSGAIAATAIYIQANPTGTSETIAVTFTEAISAAIVCVFQINDLDSATAIATLTDFETASAATTLDINTQSNGIAVAACTNATNNAAGATWTGLDEMVDNAIAGTSTGYTAAMGQMISGSTPLAISCDLTGTGDTTGVSASFR